MNTTNELITEAFYKILVEEDLSANMDGIIKDLFLLADRAKEKIAEYLKQMDSAFETADKPYVPFDPENPESGKDNRNLAAKLGVDYDKVAPNTWSKLPEKPSKIDLGSGFKTDAMRELNDEYMKEYEIKIKVWERRVKDLLENNSNPGPSLNLPIQMTKLAEKFKQEWKMSYWYPFVAATQYFPETEPIVQSILHASEMPETKKAEEVYRIKNFIYQKDTIYHDVLVVPEKILNQFRIMDRKIDEFKAVLSQKDPSLAKTDTKFDEVTNSKEFKERPRY